MKKLSSFAFALLLGLTLFAGCNNEESPDTTTPDTNTEDDTDDSDDMTDDDTEDDMTDDDMDDSDDMTDDEDDMVEREPGESPFPGYPTSGTTAEAGEYVLVPSYNWVEDAYAEGYENVTFIYYYMTMEEPGDVESKLKSVFGEEYMYPNTMFIPIPAGQSAEVGDIVLTWWQSGSGMQRSIVTDTPGAEPTVLHLDMAYDNPAGIAQETDTLKPDSFYVLSNDDTIEVGKSSACLDENGDRTHGVFTHVADAMVLTIEWAGGMNMYDKADCVAVPPQPTVAIGDTVYFPSFGTYTEGTVSNVDESIGRVWVTYDWAGSETEEVVGIQDIMVTMP